MGISRTKSLLELSTQSNAGGTNPDVRNQLEIYSKTEVDNLAAPTIIEGLSGTIDLSGAGSVAISTDGQTIIISGGASAGGGSGPDLSGSLTDEGIAVWNASAQKFDSFPALKFDGTTLRLTGGDYLYSPATPGDWSFAAGTPSGVQEGLDDLAAEVNSLSIPTGDFDSLSDTPANKIGSDGKVVAVSGTDLVYIDRFNFDARVVSEKPSGDVIKIRNTSGAVNEKNWYIATDGNGDLLVQAEDDGEILKQDVLKFVRNGATVETIYAGPGIEVGSHITADAPGTYDIGTSGAPFRSGYFSAGSVYLGAGKLSYDGNSLFLNDTEIVSGAISVSGNVADLADVSGSPSDGDVLTYDNGTSTWQPQSPSTGASYSTTEQDTGGTWIDGKTIYRTVVNWSSTFPNISTETQDISANITGTIDEVIDIRLLLKTTSGNQQLNNSNGSSDGTTDEKITVQGGARFQWNSPFNRTAGLSHARIVIEYTKV